MNTHKPTLYATMGLPASGKTFFSQRIAAELKTFFLNADALRMAICPTPTFRPKEHAMVFHTVNFIVEQHLLQGQSVVCNANYHVRKHRQELKELAERCDAHFQVIWVDVPYEVAKERIMGRQHEIPAEKMVDDPLDILDRMHKHFEQPASEEPVVRISGTIPYAQQREIFLNKVPSADVA